MNRLEAFLKMIRERRLGFMMDEVMSGSHHFVNGSGPAGEHPMSFRVTWGTRHMANYINPLSPGFMSNWLEGTVTIGGLVTDAHCRGTLDLAYFTEAKIRYTFDFKDDKGTPYRYVGEKVNLRPWNLHKTHTTCYGTIINLKTNKEVSKSIVYFKFETVPEFITSIRLG